MNTAVIERTIDIPENREVRFMLPDTLPRGQVNIVVRYVPANKKRAVSKQIVESPTIAALRKEAAQKAARRFADPSGDALQRFCGSLAHIYTEDGVVIQRGMRDEWER
jgi:hypothetical protein